MSDVEQMLKQLRDNYLAELPEKIQQMELMIINLIENKNIEDFYELYRHIHSHKGSAGTHGFSFLTAICHQLEDELSAVGENMNLITETHTKNWLAYMDLLSEVVRYLEQGKPDTSQFEDRLKSLRKTLTKTTYSCMLVDTKSATLDIINEVLKQHSIHATIMEDGYEALGHLLVNKFDMLICGMNISSFSGIGMITALKTSTSINNDIPAVLITSTSYDRTVRASDPDFIIKKDTHLSVELDDVCEKIKDILKG